MKEEKIIDIRKEYNGELSRKDRLDIECPLQQRRTTPYKERNMKS